MLHKRYMLAIALCLTACLHGAATTENTKKLTLADCFTKHVLGEPSDSIAEQHIPITASVVTPLRTIESFFGFVYVGYKKKDIALADTLAKKISVFLEEHPGEEFDSQTFLGDTIFEMAGKSIPALVEAKLRMQNVNLILSKFCYPKRADSSNSADSQDIASLDNHGIVLLEGDEYLLDDLNRMFKNDEVSQAVRLKQLTEYISELNRKSKICFPMSIPALVIDEAAYAQYVKQQLASLAS